MMFSDLLPSGMMRSEPGFARQQMERQYEILWRERRPRLALTCVAYTACLIYLPLWFCLLCAAINMLAELAGMGIMRDLDPTTNRRDNWAVMAMAFAIEVVYCLPGGLVWQIDDVHAKAFAVGMIMFTIIHLTSVRAIYLSHGIAGFAGMALTVIVSNAFYWVAIGHYAGFLVSTICVVGGLSYALIAMISNHKLHLSSAEGGRAAQQADAAKSRFLAQMSHELRTPLHAILGIGQTEMRRATNPQTHDRLALLVRAAEGLGVVLDDLLDMSAIQSGKLQITTSNAAPRDVIANTISLFQLQAEEAGLELTLDADDGLPALANFDVQRLRQCLSNLISNGLKYTQSGGVNVHALCPDTAPLMLQITVTDTGPGIPPGTETQIFEPFVRAGAQVSGTGLGLAISRALARRMGGDLVLLPSEPGKGAAFHLTIALSPASLPRAGDQPMTVPRLDGLSVLVVDDLPTNLLVAFAYLESLGAAALSATGGTEALALLQTNAVDLVLLDMNMPDPDGLQTFRMLRGSNGPQARVPVIAMTANALGPDRDRYLGEGLNGYLAKPFTEEVLAETIRAALATGQKRT